MIPLDEEAVPEPMFKDDLMAVCREAHQTAVKNGFYTPPPPIAQMLVLIAQEVGEMVQADRKGEEMDVISEEAADVFIRTADLIGHLEEVEWIKKSLDTMVFGGFDGLQNIYANGDATTPELVRDYDDIPETAAALLEECGHTLLVYRLMVGFHRNDDATVWVASVEFVQSLLTILMILERNFLYLKEDVLKKMAYNKTRPYKHGARY